MISSIRTCLTRLAATLAVLALAGCLYDFPISGPSTNIDTRLLGVFEYRQPVTLVVDGEEIPVEHIHRMAVVRQDVDRYTILYKNVATAPDTVLRFTGWISRLGEQYYVTFRDDTPGSATFGKYGFVNYQWAWPHAVILEAPGLDPEAITSSFRLRQIARSMLRNESLFPFQPTRWDRIARVWWDMNSDDPTANIPEDF